MAKRVAKKAAKKTAKKTTSKKEPSAKRPPAASAAAPNYKPRAWKYGVHPGVAMVAKWVEELPAKTGRSLAQWVALVKKEGPEGFQKRVDWLKAKHGFGTNGAWWIVERAEGRGNEDETPEKYIASAIKSVEAMYAGAKADLRPLYDKLMELSLSIANDVKACPCATMVPIFRKNVIAQIKPTTRTRIDFGLALGDTKGSGRLIETGGFAKKDRITHRIEITQPSDIDPFVEKWLREAYKRNA